MTDEIDRRKSMRWEGTRLLITGAASGLGAELAQQLAHAGARLALLDVVATAIPEAAGERAQYFVTDVAREDSVVSAFADARHWLGGLDMVVHLAGIMQGQGRLLADFQLDEWRRVIELNLTGSFLVAREAVRSMDAGLVVLTSSEGGTTKASGSVAYGASKGGVRGLVLSGRCPAGVKLLEYVPPLVDTPLVRASLEEAGTNGVSQQDVEFVSKLAIPVQEAVTRLVEFLEEQSERSEEWP